MAQTVTAVGDSLTAGVGGGATTGGWRGQVFLTNRPDLTTIGSQNGPGEIAPHDLHEGHGGYTSGQFKSNEPAWYIANPADISMIMFGTNDALQELSAATCIQNIVDAVGLILGQNAGAFCIVADPPNFHSDVTTLFPAKVTILNAIVAGLAGALASAFPGNGLVQHRATPAHPDGDFDPDLVHFNDTGYAREATAWTTALAALRRRPSTAEVASWKALVGV